MRIDAIGLTECLATISRWARTRRGRAVCLANVHMVVETCRSTAYRAVLDSADLVLFDSRILVWAAWILVGRPPAQIRGTDLVLAVCREAEARGYSIGFLGGTPDTLSSLTTVLSRRHPRLDICYAYSPPFRALTPNEERDIVAAINAAGPALLFVGLGCPRQETWIAGHKADIPATMFGVGAAFDFIAGTRIEAPRWMQKAGLEWAFRLVQEPTRLFRRYAYTNGYFLVMLAAHILFGWPARSSRIAHRPEGPSAIGPEPPTPEGRQAASGPPLSWSGWSPVRDDLREAAHRCRGDDSR